MSKWFWVGLCGLGWALAICGGAWAFLSYEQAVPFGRRKHRYRMDSSFSYRRQMPG